MTGRQDLSDAEWAVISGIFYILRTGAAWRYNTDEVLEALADACRTEADPRLSELRRRRAG